MDPLVAGLFLNDQAPKRVQCAGRLGPAVFRRGTGAAAPVLYDGPAQGDEEPSSRLDAGQMTVRTEVHVLNTAEEVSAALADTLLEKV